MSYSYIATSQKPTGTSQAVVCNFTSSNERNLILAKGNNLEIQTLKDDGLVIEMEVPLLCRIQSLEAYRPANATSDFLFVLSERKQFCVLSYNAQEKKVITKILGDVSDKTGREIDLRQCGLVDPGLRLIGIFLYEGQIKILPLEGATIKESFNLALEETQIIDLVFLYGTHKPLLCMLYQDNRNNRHLKTLSIDIREKEIKPEEFHQKMSTNPVEYGAHLLIPVPTPVAGVIVVGARSITYYGGKKSNKSDVIQACEIEETQILSFCNVSENGTRFLLGDHRGFLYLLVLKINSNTGEVESLLFDFLGFISIPESLGFLGDGLVFVGSRFGDSQLIQLLTEKNEEGSFVDIIDTFTNIGPILDMVWVDNEKEGGQRQIVTCSGAYKDGSLRVIRSGIGLHEQASLDVIGIKRVWSLKPSSDAVFDKFLVQSFIGETRVLAIEEEEMGEIEIDGFSSQEATIHCANMKGNYLLQVTTSRAILINSQSFQVVDDFRPTALITGACSSETQLVLALSGGVLHYLELQVNEGKFRNSGMATLDQDIACLSMRPVQLSGTSSSTSDFMEVEGDNSENNKISTILAVGMWTDNSIRLLTLPTLQEFLHLDLKSDTQARDVLLVDLSHGHTINPTSTSSCFLMVGMGDGQLITYQVELDVSTGLPMLSNRKEGVLGTHPISFTCFFHLHQLCVFAACDRPTIVYLKHGKLLFSVLDTPTSSSNAQLQHGMEITGMAPFHAEMFPGCLALSSEASLLIGTIEDIQKVHVQTIPLDEAPRRIAYHQTSSTYAVCTEKTKRTDQGDISKNRILFLHGGTLEVIGCFELNILEQGLSCVSCHLDFNFNVGGSSSSGAMEEDNEKRQKEFFVVGTAHLVQDDIEPSKGRILFFEVTEDNKINLVGEKETSGAVYSLAPLNGKFVAGVGSKVQIYRFKNREGVSPIDGGFASHSQLPEIQQESSHTGNVMVLFLKTKGDLILVGDLIRSVTVLQVDSGNGGITELARDFNSNYMRAVEVMQGKGGELQFLGCDDFGNLFSAKRMTDAMSDEERCKLEIVGEFHMGDYCNVMRPGTLVGQPLEDITASSEDPTSTSTSKGKSSAFFRPSYPSITGLALATLPIIYGTTNGSIGHIIPLSEEAFQFFSCVERSMQRIISTVGGFSHLEWRSFRNDLRDPSATNSSKSMIDGDLVERLLELSDKDLAVVTKEVNDSLNNHFNSLGAEYGGNAAKAQTDDPSSFSGNLMTALANDKIEMTPRDLIRRVEDIARLH